MFKFASRKDKAEPSKPDSYFSFGYTGKVHFEPDYIGLNESTREIVDIEKAIVGLYMNHRMGENRGSETQFNCQIVKVGGNNRQSLGVFVSDSEDSAGRRYPLIRYMQIRDPNLYFEPEAVVTVLNDASQKYPALSGPVGQLSKEGLEGLALIPSSFNQTVNKRVLFQQTMEQLDKLHVKDLGEALNITSKHSWADVINSVVAICVMYRRNMLQPRFKGVVLPIGLAGNKEVFSSFWLQLFGSVMPKQYWCPDIVTPDDAPFTFFLSAPLTNSTLAACLNYNEHNEFFISLNTACNRIDEATRCEIKELVAPILNMPKDNSVLQLLLALRKVCGQMAVI